MGGIPATETAVSGGFARSAFATDFTGLLPTAQVLHVENPVEVDAHIQTHTQIFECIFQSTSSGIEGRGHRSDSLAHPHVRASDARGSIVGVSHAQFPG